MRRDLSPTDERRRLLAICDTLGFYVGYIATGDVSREQFELTKLMLTLNQALALIARHTPTKVVATIERAVQRGWNAGIDDFANHSESLLTPTAPHLRGAR
jgi:hypothetical protein